jgi:O-methyltransferase
MRRAYLELLKLCLCDLAGAGTVSVGRTPEGEVMSRELAGDQLRLRAAGMDWPLHGLTMVGLRRLDDLQACVESILRERIEGDLIEAGVWRGGASILMRATLDSFGASDRTVWVADSFEGFPDAADVGHPDDLGAFDFLAVPLESVRAAFARFGLDAGTRFVEGFFEDTLPQLVDRTWSLIRLDADTYDATQLALQCLYPGLAVGGYLLVDDYGALDECAAAVEDFRRQHRITEPLEKVDWTGVRWRRESAQLPIAAPAAERPRPSARSRPRRDEARVPTVEELKLRAELDTLRHQLTGAQQELSELRTAPLARLGAKLNAALRRR